MNEANMKAMQTQINIVKNELRNEMKNSIQASLSNQTNGIKIMMASLFQMNTASTLGSGSLPSNTVANPKGELKAITTRSGIVLDGLTVPTPPPFINPEEDKRVEETLTDPYLSEYTIKVPPPLVQKYKPPSQRDYKMLKALLSNKEKLQELANTPLDESCSAVILKKLPEKLGDPGKFLISCGFSELKCKALADLGASINFMPLSVWKKLGLPKLISTRITLKLANRAICTQAGFARDVFVLVGKFTFPADFVIFDYESDPRPNQHDDVPVVPEPVLVDEDEDPEEENFEEEEDPQEEEEDDMEVDIEEDENELELTYPYEEVDPLNPPLSASELEPKDVTEVENPIEHEDKTVPTSVHCNIS
nr:reverse transcriptase domain-containing protein [Tanacetum cinerariifolium]